jgi:N-acetylneuraminic acid mutarotase
VAVVDDLIYAIGGQPPDEAAARNVERYDPEADQWEPLPPLPTAREHLAAASLDGVVYVAGGRLGSLESNLATLEALDTRSLRWETLPDMPTPRGGIAAAAIGGRIHVVGGEWTTQTLDANEAFDPRTRRWTRQAPLPTARHGLGAAAVDERLHVIGGGPQPGLSVSGAHEVLRP